MRPSRPPWRRAGGGWPQQAPAGPSVFRLEHRLDATLGGVLMVIEALGVDLH